LWAAAGGDVVRAAARAGCGVGTRASRRPLLSARKTPYLLGLHPVLTAADLYRLAADEGVGHLGATPLKHTTDRLTGDAQSFGSHLVTQALEVHEADRLELVHRQPEPVELPCGYPGGLEECDARDALD